MFLQIWVWSSPPHFKSPKMFIRTFWAESSMGLLEGISLTRKPLCPVFTYLQLLSLGKLLCHLAC